MPLANHTTPSREGALLLALASSGRSLASVGGRASLLLSSVALAAWMVRRRRRQAVDAKGEAATELAQV